VLRRMRGRTLRMRAARWPRRRGEAAVVVPVAMSGFGAVAPLSGSSAAARARNGSSDSLEKIDMSLGEESTSGPPLRGRGWRGAG